MDDFDVGRMILGLGLFYFDLKVSPEILVSSCIITPTEVGKDRVRATGNI
jgi:hypothetical protein